MFCIHCGQKIRDGAKFCAYCGAPQPIRVKQPAAPAPVVEPEPVVELEPVITPDPIPEPVRIFEPAPEVPAAPTPMVEPAPPAEPAPLPPAEQPEPAPEPRWVEETQLVEDAPPTPPQEPAGEETPPVFPQAEKKPGKKNPLPVILAVLAVVAAVCVAGYFVVLPRLQAAPAPQAATPEAAAAEPEAESTATAPAADSQAVADQLQAIREDLFQGKLDEARQLAQEVSDAYVQQEPRPADEDRKDGYFYYSNDREQEYLSYVTTGDDSYYELSLEGTDRIEKWQFRADSAPVMVSRAEIDDQERVTHWVSFDTDGSILYTSDYTYDDAGHIATYQQAAADGSITVRQEYTYDADGNVLSEIDYDANGNEIGRRETTYDGDGHILTNKQTTADNSVYGNYVYTYEDGNMTEIVSYESDGSVQFHQRNDFDADGNPTQGTDAAGDGTPLDTFTYTCTDKGNILSRVATYANGVVSQEYHYAYDPDEKYLTNSTTTYRTPNGDVTYADESRFVNGYGVYTSVTSDNVTTTTEYYFAPFAEVRKISGIS